MPINETAPVSLSKERVAEIIALSQREFDDREANIKTTMVSDPVGPERPMKRGCKACCLLHPFLKDGLRYQAT